MVRKLFSWNVAAAAIAFSAGICAPLALKAQEEKVTREPIFRQAKLPNQQRVEQATQTTVDQAQLLQEKDRSGTRVASRDSADNRSITGGTPVAEAILPPMTSAPKRAPHPLDQAISIAQAGLTNMRSNVADYTALMVKRERVKGTLGDVEYMRIKVRNERQTANGATPLSIYMNFLRPKAVKGREVIWVKGQNDNKLSVHEKSGGIKGMRTFHLDPTGWLAMQGNRYPISEAGMENLIVRLIEKATRDRDAGECVVNYREGVKINGRSCSLIEVVHADQRAPYEFHKAQVFIDDQMQLPVRYASYGWPSQPGGKPVLMEEYTYVEVQLNVGLTDQDFDVANPAYSFPGY